MAVLYGIGTVLRFILEVANELPEIRVCTVDGMTMADFGKPGFAAIVINNERLLIAYFQNSSSQVLPLVG